MDFMAELDSMDLPASLHEAVSGAYSALFEDISPEILAAIRNGIRGKISAVGKYYSPDNVLRSICHGIKDGDREAIRRAAFMMKGLVKPGDTLVPIPSRTGKATTTLELANEISRLTGCAVADILEGNSRESLYAMKKAGNLPDTSYLGIRLAGPVPDSPVLVDNVIATGTTGKAALDAVPGSRLIALAELDNNGLNKPICDEWYRDCTFNSGTGSPTEPINACLESSATARLVKYLNQPSTIDISDDDDMVDTYQQAYNYFDNAREVHDVWAVHFTGAEAYEDIQQSGFSNGTTNLDYLAYTNNHSDNERSRNGWLFALPIDCPYLKHYDLGYGDCGFIIKTSGVLAHHRVDGDDEVLFRNRDVSVKIPIIFDEDYERWLAYPDSDKPLKSRSLTRLIGKVLADFKEGTEGIAPNAINESSETVTPMFESEHTRRLQEVYTLMQEVYDKLKVTFDSAVKTVKGIPELAKRIAREENISYDEAYARAKEKSDPFSMIAPHGRIIVKIREGMPGFMCRMQHVKPTVDNFALSVVFDFDGYANSYYDTNMNMVVICLKPLIERARMAVAPDIRSQIVRGEHLTLDTVWDVEDLFAILNDDSIQQVMMHELVHHVQDRVGELPDRKGYTRFFEESGLPDDDATYHDVLPHEINAEMISRLRDCFYLYSRPRAMTQIAKELYDYYMKKRLRYVPELPRHVYDRTRRQCWEIAVSMARAFVQSFEKNNGDWSKAKEKAIVRDLDSFDV